jgi:long-chain fatty acid transport protein
VTSAIAGGFAVREQSVESQGASFAGAAANGGLSSMFWNSAGVTSKSGLNSESNFSLIIPNADLTALPGSTRFDTAGVSRETDIGKDAIVPASYINYQFVNYDPRLFIGLAINSPFGLSTKPDPLQWTGSEVGLASRLFTTNVNPMLGYKFSDQFSLGVGIQLEYAKGVFKFATGSPGGPATYFEGSNIAAGATAGLMWTPTAGTAVGLGWRSAINHKLEGRFATTEGDARFAPFFPGVAASVDLKLPDIVTLSLKQSLSPSWRLLGTVEWTNWSRFENLTVVAKSPGITVLAIPTNPGGVLGVIDASWRDGWFFSTGLEYDYSKQLTLRAGAAYEITPVPGPTKRIIGIPDADRIWGSLGLTYNVSNTMAVDFAYSHIFVDNVQIDRTNIPGTVRILANLDASADIVSIALKTKWGGAPEPLK